MLRRREKTPLCLHMLWHPKCSDGPALARTIYDWFHASTHELHRAGLGLPVYYRSAPASGDNGTPRPITIEDAQVNILVPLVDEHMVADEAWRTYLLELARRVTTVDTRYSTTLYPVALHRSAYRLPHPIQRVNYLRVDHNSDPSELDAKSRRALRATRLRRQLTEVLCRHLYAFLAGTASDTPPPLTIFLSHAKRDGTLIAEALRDEIVGYGQIRAFYDENDLPIGHAFADALFNAARGNGTAAMLPVVTDAYAERSWCRAEVRLARTPQPERADAAGKPLPGNQRWHIQPVLAVQALHQRRTRAIPELGNSPAIRWRDGVAVEILDMLLLEALLSAFHRLSARRIDTVPGRHVVSWVPDAPTLLELAAMLRSSGEPLTEIAYPGHGLPVAERLAYQRYLGAVKLLTFEEATA